MEELDQGLELIARAVQHSARAGACRAMAREVPDAIRGLTKAADFHASRSDVLLDEMLAARRDISARPRLPIGEGGKG